MMNNRVSFFRTGAVLLSLAAVVVSATGCSSRPKATADGAPPPPGTLGAAPTSVDQMRSAVKPGAIPPQYMAYVMKQEQGRVSQAEQNRATMPKPGGANGAPGVPPAGASTH
jgi:hypothetical protein